MTAPPVAAPSGIAAGIYVRISHDPDAGRLGVQRQEADCREYLAQFSDIQEERPLPLPELERACRTG